MQRNPNESFEQYRARRAATNARLAAMVAPKLFWDSSSQGTYNEGRKTEKLRLRTLRELRKGYLIDQKRGDID